MDSGIEIIDFHEHVDNRTSEWRIECLGSKYVILVGSVIDSSRNPFTNMPKNIAAMLGNPDMATDSGPPKVVERLVMCHLVCEKCQTDHLVDRIEGFHANAKPEDLFLRMVKILKWRMGVPTEPLQPTKTQH